MDSPYGLPILQVSFAGEPKKVFSASLAHPFTSIVPYYNVITAHQVSVFAIEKTIFLDDSL